MTTATQLAPTDAEIAALRSEFGITSNGRGIKEFTQVREFARAVLAKWGQPSGAVPLTDEQIEDLLICGNPTDEEKRLIRMGWDAAHGINKGGQHGAE